MAAEIAGRTGTSAGEEASEPSPAASPARARPAATAAAVNSTASSTAAAAVQHPLSPSMWSSGLDAERNGGTPHDFSSFNSLDFDALDFE